MPDRPSHHVKVAAKGQVTLPADLRQRLSVKPGDLVEVRAGQRDDGPVIEVRRRPSLIEATAGIARPNAPTSPRRWHEFEEIVKDEVARRLYHEMGE